MGFKSGLSCKNWEIFFQIFVAFSKCMNCYSLEFIPVGEWAWGCVFSKIILLNELLRAVFFEHFLAKIGEKWG